MKKELFKISCQTPQHRVSFSEKALSPNPHYGTRARTYPESSCRTPEVYQYALTGNVDQNRSGAVSADGVAGHADVLSVVSVVQTPEVELGFEAVRNTAALALSKPGEALHRRSAFAAACQSHGVTFCQGTLRTQPHRGVTRSI